MQRIFLPVVFVGFGLSAAPGPLSPAQALKAFQMEKGVRVELAAAEPQVKDPVAMCFDDAGRMFVVEGRGYPFLPAKDGKGKTPPKLGTIALLQDTDGDGRFEKRTTFAEGFTFPNGVMPWKGGIFLTCAPDIWYLKDTTGDGKADVRRVVLTGFGIKSSSEQLRVASPTLGPDGWAYITSGLTDANVTSPLHPKRAAVTAKRQDGRFHPETFVYEPLAGTGQFGQCFDAGGNRFVSSNRNPLMHVVLAPGLLRRNPHYPFTDTVENVVPVAAKVYPLSPDTTAASYIPSLINKQHSGTYTSASGICIRGNSAFICEPAQNLVQRQVLTPAGATFTATHPTPGRDFLATPDQWFRPVHTTVGPDGALYICDMVRQYIDHPRYLPEDIRAKLPFKAGTNHGRIWRVILKTPAPPKPTAKQLSAAELTLRLSRADFPKVEFPAELIKLAKSSDARERFQASLQLGGVQHETKVTALARVLVNGVDDKWTRATVFSSLGEQSTELLDELAKISKIRRINLAPALKPLGGIIARSRGKAEILSVIERHLAADFGWEPEEQIALLKGIAADVRRRPFIGAQKSVFGLVAEHPPARANVEKTFQAARNRATGNQSSDLRTSSIELMAYSTYKEDGKTLLKLLAPAQPRTVQLAAAQSLGQLNDIRVASALMEKPRWGSYAPDLREAVLGVVLGRSIYQPALLAALEEGTTPVYALSPARRRALERNKTIGARAKKLFAKHVGGDRMKAYETAKPVLKMTADAANGAKMFTRACALCHTHSGQGHAVGPDLNGLRNQPAATLLLHIVVPNHEVQGAYTLYEVDTRDNQTFAGLLAADTPEQITLKLPLGLTKTLARKNIKTLRASPKSLMPDQLEKTMTKQELADLLKFLKR
ncbi:c-type cytochrome [Verrucomicrobia bacterium]|nr:c-type cytochrome [Verrucomicrobiota bacterium]